MAPVAGRSAIAGAGMPMTQLTAVAASSPPHRKDVLTRDG